MFFLGGDLVDGGGDESGGNRAARGDELVLEGGENLRNPRRVFAPDLDADFVVGEFGFGQVDGEHPEGAFVADGLDGKPVVVGVPVFDQLDLGRCSEEVDGGDHEIVL